MAAINPVPAAEKVPHVGNEFPAQVFETKIDNVLVIEPPGEDKDTIFSKTVVDTKTIAESTQAVNFPLFETPPFTDVEEISDLSAFTDGGEFFTISPYDRSMVVDLNTPRVAFSTWREYIEKRHSLIIKFAKMMAPKILTNVTLDDPDVFLRTEIPTKAGLDYKKMLNHKWRPEVTQRIRASMQDIRQTGRGVGVGADAAIMRSTPYFIPLWVRPIIETALRDGMARLSTVVQARDYLDVMRQIVTDDVTIVRDLETFDDRNGRIKYVLPDLTEADIIPELIDQYVIRTIVMGMNSKVIRHYVPVPSASETDNNSIDIAFKTAVTAQAFAMNFFSAYKLIPQQMKEVFYAIMEAGTCGFKKIELNTGLAVTVNGSNIRMLYYWKLLPGVFFTLQSRWWLGWRLLREAEKYSHRTPAYEWLVMAIPSDTNDMSQDPVEWLNTQGAAAVARLPPPMRAAGERTRIILRDMLMIWGDFYPIDGGAFAHRTVIRGPGLRDVGYLNRRFTSAFAHRRFQDDVSARFTLAIGDVAPVQQIAYWGEMNPNNAPSVVAWRLAFEAFLRSNPAKQKENAGLRAMISVSALSLRLAALDWNIRRVQLNPFSYPVVPTGFNIRASRYNDDFPDSAISYEATTGHLGPFTLFEAASLNLERISLGLQINYTYRHLVKALAESFFFTHYKTFIRVEAGVERLLYTRSDILREVISEVDYPPGVKAILEMYVKTTATMDSLTFIPLAANDDWRVVYAGARAAAAVVAPRLSRNIDAATRIFDDNRMLFGVAPSALLWPNLTYEQTFQPLPQRDFFEDYEGVFDIPQAVDVRFRREDPPRFINLPEVLRIEPNSAQRSVEPGERDRMMNFVIDMRTRVGRTGLLVTFPVPYRIADMSGVDPAQDDVFDLRQLLLDRPEVVTLKPLVMYRRKYEKKADLLFERAFDGKAIRWIPLNGGRRLPFNRLNTLDVTSNMYRDPERLIEQTLMFLNVYKDVSIFKPEYFNRLVTRRTVTEALP
jgi:hypothetical protein